MHFRGRLPVVCSPSPIDVVESGICSRPAPFEYSEHSHFSCLAISESSFKIISNITKTHSLSGMTGKPPEQLRVLLQNAYERLRKNELIVFCSIRRLSTAGTPSQLASRLVEHDVNAFQATPDTLQAIAHELPVLPLDRSTETYQVKESLSSSIAHRLPGELVTEIVDSIDDWELSKAVGLPTSLPKPRTWSRATQLDLAILTTKLALVKATPGPFYSVSAKVAIRFQCIDIIEYLYTSNKACYDRTFGRFLPLYASEQGSVKVLNWWKQTVPIKQYDHHAIDNACMYGQVDVLRWWMASGLRLEYTEAALEHASARGHVAVLDWWKASNLPLKIGRVMEMASGTGHVNVLEWWHRSGLEFKYDRVPLYHASCYGRVEALEWWLQSGLQMIYDSDALVGATRHNKPETLEWWNRSGLPIQYRLCDIEEALEDAMGGGELVRAWWEKKGVNFKANFTEWTKYQSLH